VTEKSEMINATITLLNGTAKFPRSRIYLHKMK